MRSIALAAMAATMLLAASAPEALANECQRNPNPCALGFRDANDRVAQVAQERLRKEQEDGGFDTTVNQRYDADTIEIGGAYFSAAEQRWINNTAIGTQVGVKGNDNTVKARQGNKAPIGAKAVENHDNELSW